MLLEGYELGRDTGLAATEVAVSDHAMASAEQLEWLLLDLVVAERSRDAGYSRRSLAVVNTVDELSSYLDEHLVTLLSLWHSVARGRHKRAGSGQFQV